MGCTWGKFSSLPAEKQQKFETATRKENFQTETEGRTSGRKLSVTVLFTHVFSKDMISITIKTETSMRPVDGVLIVTVILLLFVSSA